MSNKANCYIKKTIVVSISTILVAIGITLFLQSRLGSDPMTIWIDGLRRALQIPLGQAALINNGIMLILALSFARKYIHLGTVIGALATGPIMGGIDPWVNQLMGADPSLGVRIAMMLIGQVILCYAIGLNLSVKFGFGTADSLIVTLCDKFKLRYKHIKILADLLYAVCGILIGGIVGVGTLIAVGTGGPLIAWFMKWQSDPMVVRLGLTEIPECEELVE